MVKDIIARKKATFKELCKFLSKKIRPNINV